MKFKCDSKKLSRLLDKCSRTVLKTSPFARLIVTDEHVVGEASDLTIVVHDSIEADVSETGEVVVSPSQLAGMIRSCDGNVTIEAGSNRLKITDGTLNFECPLASSEGYPSTRIPSGGIEFDSTVSVLAEAFGRVSYAACSDDTRPFINCVQLTLASSEITLAATDGHRLAITYLDVTADDSAKAQILVPYSVTKGLESLIRSYAETDQKITVAIHDRGIVFRHGNAETYAITIDAVFPDFRQVMPKNHVAEVVVKPDLKRVLDASLRVSSSVDLDVNNGNLKLSCEGPDGKFEGQYQSTGNGKICVRINTSYLNAAINSIGGESTMTLLDPLSPVMLKSGRTTAVIMPMRA